MAYKELKDYLKQLMCKEITEEQFLKTLQEMRALTYEDRMKLRIIDRLPFTVWAANEQYIVKYWAGKCSEYYGWSKNEAEGKLNYLTFIDKEETAQAKTDHEAVFADPTHDCINPANDHPRNAQSLLPLLTISGQIEDTDTQEQLIAEMAVSIKLDEMENG